MIVGSSQAPLLDSICGVNFMHILIAVFPTFIYLSIYLSIYLYFNQGLQRIF